MLIYHVEASARVFVLQMLYGSANLSSRGNGYIFEQWIWIFDNNVTKYGIYYHKDRNSLFGSTTWAF